MKTKYNNAFVILTVVFLITFITLILTLSYHLLYSRQKQVQTLFDTEMIKISLSTNKEIIKNELYKIYTTPDISPYEYIFLSEKNKKIWLTEDEKISKNGYIITEIIIKNKNILTSDSVYNTIFSTLIKQKSFPFKLNLLAKKEILDIKSNKKFIIIAVAEIEFKNKNIYNPTTEILRELHIYDEDE